MEPSRQDLVDLVADPASGLDNANPVIRRMAASNLSPDAAAGHAGELAELLLDGDDEVRAAAAEALGRAGPAALPALLRAARDEAPNVRESAATAMGELGVEASLDWLIEAAHSDPDRSVREAAVAAMGALGNDRAVGPLLDLVAGGPPTVRRRAIAALTVFDDDRIEPAIRRAALDRNPGVRETAEMVVGRQVRDPDPAGEQPSERVGG